VKEQLRINREEEKQRQLEEKNINDDHRKMLKIAEGLTTKVSARGVRHITQYFMIYGVLLSLTSHHSDYSV